MPSIGSVFFTTKHIYISRRDFGVIFGYQTRSILSQNDLTLSPIVKRCHTLISYMHLLSERQFTSPLQNQSKGLCLYEPG